MRDTENDYIFVLQKPGKEENFHCGFWNFSIE